MAIGTTTEVVGVATIEEATTTTTEVEEEAAVVVASALILLAVEAVALAFKFQPRTP